MTTVALMPIAEEADAAVAYAKEQCHGTSK